MKPRKSLFIILAALLTACGGGNSKNGQSGLDSILEEGMQNNIEISAESMNAIIESIPSPIEISMIIKNSGTTFNEGLLNQLNNESSYTTDQSKALAIGIYSGDMGYINIYEKTFLTVNYLNTVKRLADEVNIGQFFDFETIKRLASNNDKMDSLIFLSTINFNKMDSYLREQRRNNMSILMVTGAWMEGLYIASSNFKGPENKEIMEWIGHQKVITDQLLLGLSAFKKDPYFQKLIDDMTSMKEIYKNITIKYEYHEPESVEVDGRLVIVDKSTSTADITPDQVNQIRDLITKSRTRLIKNL